MVACRSLACRSPVNRALLSLVKVTAMQRLLNDTLVLIARFHCGLILWVITLCGGLSNRETIGRFRKRGFPMADYTKFLGTESFFRSQKL